MTAANATSTANTSSDEAMFLRTSGLSAAWYAEAARLRGLVDQATRNGETRTSLHLVGVWYAATRDARFYASIAERSRRAVYGAHYFARKSDGPAPVGLSGEALAAARRIAEADVCDARRLMAKREAACEVIAE